MVYLNHTYFESIIFPASRKHAGRCYLSRKSMKSCLGVTPVYIKTVSQWVVSRIRTQSLRLLTPNTAFLVRIIQIHTNFGWLKWLVKMAMQQKIFYLDSVVTINRGVFTLYTARWNYTEFKIQNFKRISAGPTSCCGLLRGT